jgi:hypothetical protein
MFDGSNVYLSINKGQLDPNVLIFVQNSLVFPRASASHHRGLHIDPEQDMGLLLPVGVWGRTFGMNCLVPRRYKTISHTSHYIKGLHEVVHHTIGAQRRMGYERLKPINLCVCWSRCTVLHVNLSYSNSHTIFLLAPGDKAVA